MTIGALLLGRQFYDLNPGPALKYATLGLLFVNVSIGGTLDPFRGAAGAHGRAALGLGHAVHARRTSDGVRSSPSWSRTLVYFLFFRRELRALAARPPQPDVDRGDENIHGATVVPAVVDSGLGHGGAPPVPAVDGR